MTLDAELGFADQVGRHYARQYGMPPMVGRVIGWLMICDPPAQTVAQLAEALHASRSAIGTALTTLESMAFVQRSRAAGERVDRISMNPAYGEQALESPAEYGAQAALLAHGLEVLAGAPEARRARLLEMKALTDWLLERTPQLAAEWRERRDALRASGQLPDPS
jgi:DNA-binding MarR family transcriptional regulator